MRRRSGWLLPVLIVLLVALPIVEVWLLIQVGEQIGVLATIGVLVVEAAVGAWLMKREGTRAWTALNGALQTGRMPSAELTDAALVLVGGVLLMLPGFLSDVIGFLFLLPLTRPLARKLVGYLVARRVNSLGLPTPVSRLHTDGVIRGETVPDPDQSSDPGGPRTIRGEIDDQR
ncbi:MAG TPA: FxsA family protein [Propionibacteriaceae bacterium]|nr:FxsA family protein [Propionibacteriaceae bacterium]